jgi:sulfotransferase
MKTLHFISGLPRAGSGLICDILKQNPDIHYEYNSNLVNVFNNVNIAWNKFQTSYTQKIQQKIGVLSGILQGYYHDISCPIVLDNNIQWISQILSLETVLQRPIKIVVCVRNPAEILTSFEKFRKQNPMITTAADQILREHTSVAARAFHYAGPDGILGVTHRNIKDAIVMGYLDRMLFVDYNRFCNSPRNQTQRIYDFLELPKYNHDFENISQQDILTGDDKISSIEKITVNCVEYLGLELFEQYNREIFWNAWI